MVHSLQSLHQYRYTCGNWKSMCLQEISFLPMDHDTLELVQVLLGILFYFQLFDSLLLLQWFLAGILVGVL